MMLIRIIRNGLAAESDAFLKEQQVFVVPDYRCWQPLPAVRARFHNCRC